MKNPSKYSVTIILLHSEKGRR